MDKMTEEDVSVLKIGDVIYDSKNKAVEVLDICEYTVKLREKGFLGIKRIIWEVPAAVMRNYTIHKREYSNG